MVLDAVGAVSGFWDKNLTHRPTMEDAHVVVDRFGGDPGTAFFGVYDGHGGDGVANYLASHLHDNVEAEFRAKGGRAAEECLKTAFLFTDVQCAKHLKRDSGSTAVVCVVRSAGAKQYVFTANCGDARAVLCHDGAAVRLSKDHKATTREEVSRIRAAGGFIARERVMGVLAVARSFGDFALKRYVTCDPYTSTTKLNEKSQFLIIACDGVWDVLSDRAAVDLVKNHVAAAGRGSARARAKHTSSELLVRRALELGSTDNITALVVFLHKD